MLARNWCGVESDELIGFRKLFGDETGDGAGSTGDQDAVAGRPWLPSESGCRCFDRKVHSELQSWSGRGTIFSCSVTEEWCTPELFARPRPWNTETMRQLFAMP